MSTRIAYGIDTESIEDANQLVLIDLPDQCDDMDSDEMIEFINTYWEDPILPTQPVVGSMDVMEKLTLILHSELFAKSISNETAKSIFDKMQVGLGLTEGEAA